MSTSLAVPEHYRRTFENIWNHEVQQMVSRLRGRTVVKSFEGKELVVTDLDDFEWEERQGRLGDSNPTEVTAKKRKIIKRDFRVQKIFDRNDKEFFGQLGQPDSEVIQEMKYGWNRLVDAKILEAASGMVYGGAEPYVTPIELPTSQKIAVDYGTSPTANIGLTPSKIIRAGAVFEENEIMPEEEEIFLALGPKEKEDLIAYVAASPNDVWAKMISAWLDGSTKKLFSFTPILTNNITVDSSDIATVVAFSKNKGVCTAPEKMTIEIDKIPTKDHAVQLSAYAEYGFMRRYEKGVVEIACDRSPA